MQQAPTDSPEPEPTNGKSPSRRPRRPWLWLGGLSFAVSVTVLLGFNGWWAFQLDRAINDLKQRGEPITQAEAHALTVANAPDDHENLAKIPALMAFQQSEKGLAALRHLELENPAQHELLHCPNLDLHGMTRAMEIDAKIETGKLRASNPDADPVPVPCFYELTARLHPAVHELANATRDRPRAFWNRTEGRDPASLRSMDLAFHGLDLSRMENVAWNIQRIAIIAMDADDPALACAAVELQLALARAFHEGNAREGGWSVIDLQRAIRNSLHHGLGRRVWNEEQLASLQTAVEQTLPSFDIENLLRMERINMLHVHGIIKHDRTRVIESNRWIQFHPVKAKLIGLMPGGMFDRATLRGIRLCDADSLGPTAVEDPPFRSREIPEWLRWLEDPRFMEATEGLDKIFAPDFRRLRLFAVYVALEQARMRMAHAAIALERHHLRHGRYPNDWSEMIPATLAEPPLDPFTGGELRLLPVDGDAGRTRPVIYSLGLNRTDNGGVHCSIRDSEDEYYGRPPVTGDLLSL